LEVASQLWTAEFVESLRQAEQAETSTEGNNGNRDEFDNEGGRGSAADSRTPTLLATIPLESARKALGDLFEASAEEGPAPWTSMRLFGGDAVDPALLVLSKNMYHTGSTRRTTRTRRSTERGDDVDTDSQQDEWARAVESFVGELCRQFRSAATDKGVSVADDSSPFKLHKDAQVVARYRLQWPKQIDGRLAGVSVAPLDIEYIRIEEENLAQRLLSTYRRQAGSRSQERRISGGVWIDGFEKRDMRSIDIRITGEGDLGLEFDDDADRRTARRTPSRGRDRRDSRSTEDDSRSDEPVPIVVEILSVGIQQPQTPDSPDSTTEAAAAASAG
jgi:hypothetical protein